MRFGCYRPVSETATRKRFRFQHTNRPQTVGADREGVHAMHMRKLVQDDRMPSGVDWLVVRSEGKRFLFVRESLCDHDCGACPILKLVLRVAPPAVAPAVA